MVAFGGALYKFKETKKTWKRAKKNKVFYGTHV